MAREIEDVHDAFPYRLAFERLADGQGLGERRGATVHALDGFLELYCGYFHLSGHILGASSANLA